MEPVTDPCPSELAREVDCSSAGGAWLVKLLAFSATLLAQLACVASESSSETLDGRERPGVYRTPATRGATQYVFKPEDEVLLDAIEYGAFEFFRREVGAETGFVKDNRVNVVSNLGGVGFQLSSLPIGVTRGWESREEAESRALKILRSLRKRNDNRREGVHLHFVVADTGDMHLPYRNEASTVDHALLLAGAMTAASFFGGEVAEIVDRMAVESNWRAFIDPESNTISMGWRPDDNRTMSGLGSLISNTWRFASDEERIIAFLAVGAPTPDFALPPESYYRLRRPIKRLGDGPPFSPSWNGIPFNYFFSHCWIDYRRFAADRPEAFGIDAPRIDWFENSRRALLAHRARCLDAATRYSSFGEGRWGVSSCMGFDSSGKRAYLVQQVMPNLAERDQWRGGTVAPYAAAGAIMFTPAETMEALRAFRKLTDKDGAPLIWRDPRKGGYGFVDSFNLDQGLVMEDNLAIDVGPTLLAIENVRSGLIWDLFMKHPLAQQSVQRLRWTSDIASE